MTRRAFAIRHLDDGAVLLTAGRRMMRLSALETAELADEIAAPVIEREITRITGVER